MDNKSDSPFQFEEFSEITRMQQNVTITEKVHGTNAQILIVDTPDFGTFVKAGSRNRWLTVEDDNYGFARWVADNEAALIQTLGPGRHYGEWFGSGINSGYGYTKGKKRFALFNTHRWSGLLPVDGDLTCVPVLYSGPWRHGIIEEVMAQLKEKGSQIAPGFMNPEGVVVRFDRAGVLFKQVFEAEETGWKGVPKSERAPEPGVDQAAVNALYQPIRLEKLLSKDERYLRDYPKTLPDIVRGYVADMEKEAQLESVDERVVKAFKAGLFAWTKQMIAEKGYKT